MSTLYYGTTYRLQCNNTTLSKKLENIRIGQVLDATYYSDTYYTLEDGGFSVVILVLLMYAKFFGSFVAIEKKSLRIHTG